ncbi:hypothetical protein O3G_MSEX001299 [Manduca sexta]|uniref:Uncharacterized protein n=1 Tax=Manduca sexta TaxID=7130 RepID=A0A921YK94_MANSE|nr:hypothetical protein O3G_MSEX001299 [Manduca sexta]
MCEEARALTPRRWSCRRLPRRSCPPVEISYRRLPSLFVQPITACSNMSSDLLTSSAKRTIIFTQHQKRSSCFLRESRERLRAIFSENDERIRTDVPFLEH